MLSASLLLLQQHVWIRHRCWNVGTAEVTLSLPVSAKRQYKVWEHYPLMQWSVLHLLTGAYELEHSYCLLVCIKPKHNFISMTNTFRHHLRLFFVAALKHLFHTTLSLFDRITFLNFVSRKIYTVATLSTHIAPGQSSETARWATQPPYSPLQIPLAWGAQHSSLS